MADVLRMPRFLGGRRAPQVPLHDPEVDAMGGIGQWLAGLPDDDARFRCLAYWMWRLKSGKSPQIAAWVDEIAEECAIDLGGKSGFTGRPQND